MELQRKTIALYLLFSLSFLFGSSKNTGKGYFMTYINNDIRLEDLNA